MQHGHSPVEKLFQDADAGLKTTDAAIGLDTTSQDVRRVAVTVRGVVQGVGFRPFVYREARGRGLRGWVQNEADALRMEILGPATGVADFLAALTAQCPPQARIESIEVVALPLDKVTEASVEGGFEIRSSPCEGDPSASIPADLATCPACTAEIFDPAQRRYRYPFTNCTNCGPRWSIIRKLPYDRPRTSMASFPMCRDCQSEYDAPGDRRFHAQPIACPRCGPQLRLLDANGRQQAETEKALQEAARAVRTGQVVAIQGLGGFQLVVDATDAEAVARLRNRKRRPDRPFAIMFPALESVRSHCLLSDEEARTLLSPPAPILLLRRRSTPIAKRDAQAIADNIAPGNPYLGVMLPYTPLHHLLMESIARPVVCSSGNLSEEPMAIEIGDALQRLGGGNAAGAGRPTAGGAPSALSHERQAADGDFRKLEASAGRQPEDACYRTKEPIADWLLVHDRPIERPVDDSVARFRPDGLQVLRRARGFAPLPIMLDLAAPPLLATGGQLKNTVALALGGARPSPVVLSQHIGDLESAASFDLFQRTIDDLLEFYAARPQAVACDLHPDYVSARYAEELAGRLAVPLVRVQHHHAHVAACMAEHRLAGPVLGLSWDGTGYGTDGTIWGGEALLCRGGEHRRIAHLRTFPLPGGDQAARQPRRAALGLLYEVLGPAAFEHVGSWFSRAEQRALAAMLLRGVNCPRTSSMGRLFDAVAALCGKWKEISYEGQAAMELEFAADAALQESYDLPLVDPADRCAAGAGRWFDNPADAAALPGTPPHPSVSAADMCSSHVLPAGGTYIADWEPMIRAILADRRHGASMARIAALFHNALAGLAVRAASVVQCGSVVLTGGCFQNALLSDKVQEGLQAAGHVVYTHLQIPPGDGGIALGQVFVAAHKLQHDVPGSAR